MKELRILLVDDDEDDREFFAEALKAIQIKTKLYLAKHGQEGLEVLSSLNDFPDLIFLDLNMPIMNGLQCLEKIRAMEKGQNAIIAIYSTSASNRDIEATFLKGANVYIKKPLCFEELKSALKQVIKTNWDVQMEHLGRENYLLKL